MNPSKIDNSQLNPKHEMMILSKLIPWSILEEEFESVYDGSDFSKGILQFHYYGLEVKDLDEPLQERWIQLIEDIKLYGTVNSLVTGYPPTASSSQIQGNNECFEPYTYI